MKYLTVILFNLVALYFLYVFMFGQGGGLDNLNKMEKIHQMTVKRLQTEIELEELKSLWYEERELREPDSHFLANNGRKLSNTIIFKFRENSLQTSYVPVKEKSYQIYFMLAVGIFLVGLVLSDLLLFYYFRKPV